MAKPKKEFPNSFSSQIFSRNPIAESFPFYIEECGFCNDRKKIFGTKNNYNSFLMLYSLDGIVRYSKNKNIQYVQPNSVVTTSCNTPITFTKVSNSWKYYYIIVSGSHAKFFYNMIRTYDNIIFCSPFSSVLDSFMELYNILTDSDINNDITKYIHVSQLIHNIFTSLYDLVTNVNNIKDITPAQESNINTAIKYISKNYQNELNLEIVSNQIGYSQFYFSKLFKKQMGMTIHQYINEYRINKAKDLLAYSKLSINSIATNVGFKNTLTFIRNFEKIVHMTPSEYREYY